MDERRRYLYAKAIEEWGDTFQLFMLMEEMGELSTGVSQFVRGRVESSAVLDEIVDVEIMLDQLKVIMGHTDADVHRQKEAKLQRLAQRLDVEYYGRP